MELKDVIRQRRRDRGLSQRDLATLLKVSHGAIGQWENGDSRPGLRRLVALSAVLGIDLNPLMEPGSPYHGQLVEDPDELALLAAWREVAPDARAHLLNMIRGAALGPVENRQWAGRPVKPKDDRRQSS